MPVISEIAGLIKKKHPKNPNSPTQKKTSIGFENNKIKFLIYLSDIYCQVIGGLVENFGTLLLCFVFAKCENTFTSFNGYVGAEIFILKNISWLPDWVQSQTDSTSAKQVRARQFV